MLQHASRGADREEVALFFDVWANIAIRYIPSVLLMGAKFRKMASTDPTYGMRVFPSLSKRGEIFTTVDLSGPLSYHTSHMPTLVEKVVAAFSSSIATKRAKFEGSPVDGNYSPFVFGAPFIVDHNSRSGKGAEWDFQHIYAERSVLD